MARTRLVTLVAAALATGGVLVGALPAPASAAMSSATFETRFAGRLVEQGALSTRSSQAVCMDRLLARKLAKRRVASAGLLGLRCDVAAPYVTSVKGRAKPQRLASVAVRRNTSLRNALRTGTHLAVEARRSGGRWTVVVAVAKDQAEPDPTTSPTPEQVTIPGVPGEIIAQTNAERVAEGLSALSANSCLMANAQRYAEFMAAREMTLVHQDLGDVRAECDASGWVGENILYNYDGSAGFAMTQWLTSPGHLANILNVEYRMIGVGQARSASGRYYAVQVFASGVA